MTFSFKVKHKSKTGFARTGEIYIKKSTNSSEVIRKMETPALAIVATEGEIKAVPQQYISKLPNQYLIVNTFHIYTKNILEQIESKKGIHNYMDANNKLIASDSGGFQVFSLGFGKSQGVGKIGSIFPDEDNNNNLGQTDSDNPLQITDHGVTFTFNKEKITLTPAKSMEIQKKIGTDIIFAFDECTSPLNSKQYTAKALERTHEWIKDCITHLRKQNKFTQNSANKPHYPQLTQQALFGIIQGGSYEDLRKQSARYFAKLDVPGYGIGGSLGNSKQDMHEILEWIMPILPDGRPRHLLGIGHVRDLFECVERGIDLFDCVVPTREARHKMLYTKKGKFPMRKIKTAEEPLEIDYEALNIEKPVTFKDLYNLFLKKSPEAYMFATLQNIYFFSNLMTEIREAINSNSLTELKEQYFKYY